MHKRPDQYDVVHAKPVFAVGGTVSGYGSMGSAESLNNSGDKSVTGWTEPRENHQINNQALTQAANMTQELQSLSQARSNFKSAFAKELHQENVQRNSPSWRSSGYRSSFIDEVINEDTINDTNNDTSEKLETEYVRVKRENEILKRRLSEYNKEDEKYKKLQFEIEQLTWQLGKMEQSREVYETATNQLGSFLELVSSKLTMNRPPGAETPGLLMDRMSGLSVDRHLAIPGSKGSRSSISVRKRSESENRRKSGHLSSQRNSRYMEDPSLSPSISCTSSSLNTSCASECDRVSSRGTRRTSDKIKLNQDGKFDEGSEISAQGENRPDDGVYNNISILSSCTCNEEDEIDNVAADFNARKSSKTRNTLKRITSFMRKDKSKNLSLVDTSGPASMKYSSEHFSDPSSSVNIIGFRGIWSLRNY